MEDKYNEKDYDQLALEEVVYGNQHTLTILLDLLIEKGVITEQEFKDKLNEMIEKSENAEDVDIPELDENNLENQGKGN